MLNQLQRDKLQAFVHKSPPGTGFLQRAQIVLLADDGKGQEEIASELEISIVRVRQFLRAFNRQGTDLFPEQVLAPERAFSPDLPVSEVARQIMKELLGQISTFQADLIQTAGVKAVHESRKSMRSLRTALRLFEPYFEAGALEPYRKRFRKAMRRMAPARDYAVFEGKLSAYIAEVEETDRYESSVLSGLRELQRYWGARLATEGRKIERYMTKGKYERLLAEFESFLTAEIPGTASGDAWPKPSKARHVIPVLIAQKVAEVRAFDDALEAPSPKLLHHLRIRTKVLRYTIEFFEPVLGPTAGDALSHVKGLLVNLGDLNDTRVALVLLDKTPAGELSRAIEHYRETVASEMERLTTLVLRDWETLESVAWRQSLARSTLTL